MPVNYFTWKWKIENVPIRDQVYIIVKVQCMYVQQIFGQYLKKKL